MDDEWMKKHKAFVATFRANQIKLERRLLARQKPLAIECREFDELMARINEKLAGLSDRQKGG